MSRLNEILGQALSEARFDIGRVGSTEGHPSRSYALRREEIVSVGQLREIFEQGVRDDGGDRVARSAHLVCSEESISELVNFLWEKLESYIDPKTERIGHAFPPFSGSGSEGHVSLQEDGRLMISSITPVESFARALVKGSALVGSEYIASLVMGWAEGEPIRYRTCAILNGIVIDEPLAIGKGVQIIVLPTSTSELAKHLASLPSTSLGEHSGRTMVMIDSSESPSLFRPGGSRQSGGVQAPTHPQSTVEIVCRALSLLSDTYVDAEACWNDYLELRDWLPISVGLTWSLSSGVPRGQRQNDRFLRKDHQTGMVTVSAEGRPYWEYREAELTGVLNALAEPQFRKLGTATSRWMKSKNPSDGLVDQFVDLRMAIESLYLQDFTNEQSQEMRFRLALFGAWFLGTNFQDRKLIRKTLRDAYDRASGAVHTGEIEPNTENRELLADAQELCRRGILRMLKEGFPLDWGDLVLGGIPETSISGEKGEAHQTGLPYPCGN